MYVYRSTRPLGLLGAVHEVHRLIFEEKVCFGRTKGNEELGIIRVLCPVISHTNKTSMCVAETRVDLILEGLYGII